jgi:NADPH-dependent glutamate synthase beta subunit-like oxidoreductase/NAD-dependent dihydropyrimidine dehydrogenase PreA subunit
MALRPKIVQLAKMIGGMPGIMFKIDEKAPEYYLLECCVSDDQADVGLAMGLRHYRSAEELAKRCGKSVEETSRLALELAQIGVCNVNNIGGVDKFIIHLFAPGVLEHMVNNRELVAKYPQIGKAFEEYSRIRVAQVEPMLPMGQSMMRVIPIESAISADTKVVPSEQISYYLNKYDIFSVTDCSCRVARRILGEGCGHLETDMCVHMGLGAEYYIRTGRARQVTREEAAAIFKKAEENGLMHQMPNTEELGDAVAICNCCGCSCFANRQATMFGGYDACGSNYRAEVDEDKCVACGQCVENCPTNALKLGQKLCTKTPLDEPAKHPNIKEHIWTRKNWNVDYRTNRKDVVDTGTAPCKTNCPAHIAVQGYVKMASLGKYSDALELIKKENPFPAVCGRICPRKCETECTRGDIDEPIAVDEIKKFIADQELNEKTRFIPKKRYNYAKPIAVIGAGPAGLTCAYFLAIDGYKVTVFEKEQKLGGMLTLGIPSFRLEKNVVNAEIDVLKSLGVEFKTGVEVGKDITLNDLRNQGFKAFYIAVGAQGGRKLGLEGENAEGVIAGVDLLRDVNLGKDVKLNGKVIVIGGGNVAIDVARTAVRTGAENVDMFCLEARKEMPALEEEISEAEEEGITINNSWGPKKIVVENGKLKGVEFKKCISVFDNDGRFSPQYDESVTMMVEASCVLLSVGQSIEWGRLLEGSNVVLNRNNTVQADGFTYQTAAPDIFVGGDSFTGPKFAIDAIAAGKEGAISIHRFVQPGQSLVLGRDHREYQMLDKENLVIEGYDNAPRQKVKHADDKVKSFRDPRVTFTEEQVKAETARCLGCGAVQVDVDMCIGCGQCTTKCKFDAITLKKVYNEYGGMFEHMPFKIAPYAVKRVGKIAIRSIKDMVGIK